MKTPLTLWLVFIGGVTHVLAATEPGFSGFSLATLLIVNVVFGGLVTLGVLLLLSAHLERRRMRKGKNPQPMPVAEKTKETNSFQHRNLAREPNAKQHIGR